MLFKEFSFTIKKTESIFHDYHLDPSPSTTTSHHHHSYKANIVIDGLKEDTFSQKKMILGQLSIFDLMEKPKVTLIDNGVKREILRRTMMKIGRFFDYFEHGNDLSWEGPNSQEGFSDFLKLLENSKHSEEKKNINLISLLEDWGCSDIIDNLISQVKSEFDYTIIHNGHQYPVNLKIFSTLSKYFCSQVKNSGDAVVSVSDEFSEETFSLFLDCLLGIKSLPQDDKQVDIYQICQNWECNSLLDKFDTQSTSFIVSALSKGDLIEQKTVEENATQQIHSLIHDPRFYQLPLSTLNRIVSKSCIHEITDSILIFIENLLEAYSINAFFIIFSLDFSTCTEETVLQILQIMSNHSHSSYFQKLKSQFSSQPNELKKWKTMFEEQKKLTEYGNKKIEELNQQIKRKEEEDRNRIEQLNILLKKKGEDQKTIEDLNQKLQQKESGVQMKDLYDLLSSQMEFKRIGKWKLKRAPDFEDYIYRAAEEGKLSSVIYLLANGDYNHKVKSDILMGAVDNHRYPVVEYLLHQGFNFPEIYKNQNLLHYAAQNGHLCVVECLI